MGDCVFMRTCILFQWGTMCLNEISQNLVFRISSDDQQRCHEQIEPCGFKRLKSVFQSEMDEKEQTHKQEFVSHCNLDLEYDY